MKKKWTRRKFLRAGLASSVVVGAGAVSSIVPPKAQGRDRSTPQREKPTPSGLSPHARDVVRAAMDEIIPSGDGMPAASEVGCLEYLDRLARKESTIAKELEKSLSALEEVSRDRFKNSFLTLSRPQRVEALKGLEKQKPATLFANLRDYVYEAYYIQPRVWKLIGYEFYPTDQAGPRMKPFDESVLARVRKMPKFYREVP